MVRIVSFGVEIFVHRNAPPFCPGYRLRDLKQPKKFYGQILLEGLQELIKFVRKLYTHR